jgi:hypothetical protein
MRPYRPKTRTIPQITGNLKKNITGKPRSLNKEEQNKKNKKKGKGDQMRENHGDMRIGNRIEMALPSRRINH